MRHLYEIEIDPIILYVTADSEDEAKTIALQNIENEVDNLSKWNLCATVDPECLDANWLDSEPYGDDPRTVKEIWQETQEKKQKAKEYQ